MIASKRKTCVAKQNEQQGIALVMALILLLLITMIGVSAVKMSNLDTQVSGNSIYSALVFQGAESALGRAASDTDITNIIPAAAVRGHVEPVPAAYFNPIQTVMGGVDLNSSADVVFEGVLDSPIQNYVANDSEFQFQVFRVNAESRLTSTSAKDNHSEGIAKVIPK